MTASEPAAGAPAAGRVTAQLRLIRSGELSAATGQTSGMIRSAAISGDLTGARSLWMGRTELPPGVNSGDHHHGESETGIYVVAGTPVFVCRDPATGELTRLETRPGDYVWVPPHVPHREENPSPDQPAVVVIARSTRKPSSSTWTGSKNACLLRLREPARHQLSFLARAS